MIQRYLFKLLGLFCMFTPQAFAEAPPKTVLELSGAKRPEINWSNSILLIIDAQNEYREGRLLLPGIEKSLGVIRSLMNKARKNHAPVVHIHHHGKIGGLFDPTTDRVKSLPEVAPAKGEAVIIKKMPNSFTNTDLKKIVDQFGKDKILILTGYMTHNCISSTARGALDLGYITAVVSDGVGARRLPDPNGITISSEDISRANLAGLQERTSWIIKSDILLK